MLHFNKLPNMLLMLCLHTIQQYQLQKNKLKIYIFFKSFQMAAILNFEKILIPPILLKSQEHYITTIYHICLQSSDRFLLQEQVFIISTINHAMVIDKRKSYHLLDTFFLSTFPIIVKHSRKSTTDLESCLTTPFSFPRTLGMTIQMNNPI